ncbi:hypothetical protein [Paraliobacillus ryukyuensis]|uniref:hypothetical protein n=1 Tax=Paraliobacillus ryukyuensis TaxID=200904 RepID=UPI0009A58A70|nr:hypothetical protein [Paraliobacillus ryukyuensis]
MHPYDPYNGYDMYENNKQPYDLTPADFQSYGDMTEPDRQSLLPSLPFFDGGTFGGGPGTPPPFPPSGQTPQDGPPMGPPPAFTPTQQAQPQQAQVKAVDPGSIQGCLYRYTYIWLNGFQQFWFYPTYVGRRSVSGYRWNGFRWVYFGIDLRQIQSFTCV